MRYRALLVLALALSGCASTAGTSADSTTERLNFFVPKGWKIGHQAQGNDQAIIEIIPEKETVQSWTRMITVQTFRNPEKYQPELFINGMGELAKKACEGATLIPVRNGEQNGYAFSQKILVCTNNRATKTNETMNIKAIKGGQSFYVVQVASRSAMPDEEMRYWAIYLRDVTVGRR